MTQSVAHAAVVRPRGLRGLLRGLPHEVVRTLRRHDVLLYGGGVTFYAALALVPLVLLAVRLASVVVGEATVRELASSLGDALPDALGAPGVVANIVERGVDLGWLGLAITVLPASLYGEGLRRAYASVAGVDDRLLGWKGRLAALPLLVCAPLLLLAVLAITPALVSLASSGPGGVALGIYLSLNVDWVVVSLPLAWSYRIVSPDPPSWGVALVGGFVTGAFVSGFLQGFVLFLSLPLDLGAPFGGAVPVGGVVAGLLWLWVLHLVVLVGYVATRALERRRARQRDGGGDAAAVEAAAVEAAAVEAADRRTAEPDQLAPDARSRPSRIRSRPNSNSAP